MLLEFLAPSKSVLILSTSCDSCRGHVKNSCGTRRPDEWDVSQMNLAKKQPYLDVKIRIGIRVDSKVKEQRGLCIIGIQETCSALLVSNGPAGR